MTLFLLLGIIVFLLVCLPPLGINDGAPSSDASVGMSSAALDALTKLTTLTSASTAYTLDSILVQGYASGLWRCDVTKGTAKRSLTFLVSHNGSATVAATGTPSITMVAGGAPIGTVDVAFSAVFTGSGATQAFCLQATASSTGWTAATWRIPLLKVPQ
jgi:hypothetical protein